MPDISLGIGIAHARQVAGADAPRFLVARTPCIGELPDEMACDPAADLNAGGFTSLASRRLRRPRLWSIGRRLLPALRLRPARRCAAALDHGLLVIAQLLARRRGDRGIDDLTSHHQIAAFRCPPGPRAIGANPIAPIVSGRERLKMNSVVS